MIRHTLILLASAALVLGHGRVTQPPSRASAWRLGFPTPANYDDDGLNCGGFSTQWSSNGGKCGICGDAYSIPSPRPHELGGMYGQGVIVAKYLPGATIATTTHLTASHMGYWEFKLCPDPTDNSQECFNQHLLVSEDGETKYTPTRGSGIYEVNYKLPTGLICEHCVLQWRYVAGNNWGICSNGTSGLGCGNQEEFRACSDIAIGVSKTLSDVGNIPSPLLFYLQNGYFELNQGYLIGKDPKRPTAPRRPTKTKPSNRQPKSNQPPQNSLQSQQNRQPQTFQPVQQYHQSREQPQSAKQNQPLQQYNPPSQQRQTSKQPTLNKQQYSHLQGPQALRQHHQSHVSHQPPQLPKENLQPSQQHYPQQPVHSKENRPPAQQYQPSQQPYPSHKQPQTSKQNQPSKQYHQPLQQQLYPSHQLQTSKAYPQQIQSHQNSQPLKSDQQNEQFRSSQYNRQPQHSQQLQHAKRQPDHSKKPQHPKGHQSKREKSSKRQPNSVRYEYKTSDKRRSKKNKGRKKKKAHNGHQGNQKTRSQRYKYL